uniref:Anaphase-promoting complex subunit 10 n=1 Tax=Sinocyclocheilus rhinocerous TaxID=307959 RepID=A0A673LWK2_9TELE
AVWSLSSCKPGFGVDQLRDDNLETYWQSDGSQPHLVNIQFRRKTTVKMLCIYADYKSDESYTPSKISVRVGNNFHNLQEIRVRNTDHVTVFISPRLLQRALLRNNYNVCELNFETISSKYQQTYLIDQVRNRDLLVLPLIIK